MDYNKFDYRITMNKKKGIKIAPIKGVSNSALGRKRAAENGAAFSSATVKKIDAKSAAAEPDYRAFMDGQHGHNLLLFAYIPIIIKFIIFVV